jgi:hypothetical protein
MEMKRILMMAGCLLACGASLGAVAGSASAALPEFGRCVEVAKTGQYKGAKCVGVVASHKGGYEWMPGPGAAKKFTLSIGQVHLKGSGAEPLDITCEFGEGEGEYTGPKEFTVPKWHVSDCRLPKKTEAEPLLKTWCQSVTNNRGEITGQELVGEPGYILTPTQVGVDLKPKSGSALATFECGGASEAPVERGTGLGTLVEVEGSIIGRVKKINVMTEENFVLFKVSKTTGAQVPESFEGGEKDTLITNVGLSKTSQASTLAGEVEVFNEEAMELKAK